MARDPRKTRDIAIKRVINDDSLSAMQEIASDLLVQMNSGPTVEDTAFKTARNAIGREERKRALTVFLKTLEDISHGKGD